MKVGTERAGAIIEEQATERGLVVVSSQARTGLSCFLFGSVSHSIGCDVACSVLIQLALPRVLIDSERNLCGEAPDRLTGSYLHQIQLLDDTVVRNAVRAMLGMVGVTPCRLSFQNILRG